MDPLHLNEIGIHKIWYGKQIEKINSLNNLATFTAKYINRQVEKKQKQFTERLSLLKLMQTM